MIAKLSNNLMLAKEHLESAHTKMNDSLRKGLPTVKVLVANEQRLLVPCNVLFGLSVYCLRPFRRPSFGCHSQVRILVHSYVRMVQLYRDGSARQGQLNVTE
jgi:hypothetical protein